MDNLEKYIKDNTEVFNDAEIPEGHLDRFLAKLGSEVPEQEQDSPDLPALRALTGKTVGQGSLGSAAGKRTRRILWTALAVAAASAVIIFLNRPSNESHDWFANIGNDQAEICRMYYEQVGELYEVILKNHPDGSMDESISSIAEESIPLVDQLPEDMDPEARAAILKEYYGNLLDGLEKLKDAK